MSVRTYDTYAIFIEGIVIFLNRGTIKYPIPIIISVRKPSNCSSTCKFTLLISSAGNFRPYIIIIQIEPRTEPMINMIIAVITNGLLG